MSSFLELDDAVAICMRLLSETELGDMSKEAFAEYQNYVEGEFEQKAWIASHNQEPVLELHKLTFDINPDMIAEQIKKDSLKNWCQVMQAGMRLAMIDLPLKDSASANPSNVIQIKDAVNVALEYIRQVDDECGAVVYDDYDEANETLTKWMQETAKIKSE